MAPLDPEFEPYFSDEIPDGTFDDVTIIAVPKRTIPERPAPDCDHPLRIEDWKSTGDREWKLVGSLCGVCGQPIEAVDEAGA